jgi:hypothetical protein
MVSDIKGKTQVEEAKQRRFYCKREQIGDKISFLERELSHKYYGDVSYTIENRTFEH